MDKKSGMSFALETPIRPSSEPTHLDHPTDSKVRLKIGKITLRKPKKMKFNELFVTHK